MTEDDPILCSFCGQIHAPKDGHIFESPMDTDEEFCVVCGGDHDAIEKHVLNDEGEWFDKE